MKNTSRSKSDPPVGEELHQLVAENEILKVKLQLEFGMDMGYRANLPPRDENIWLNNIYELEKKFKECRHIKVYERLGCPTVKKLVAMTPKELDIELQGLFLLMQEHGVALDLRANYDKAVLYQFITEELFEQEMDDLEMSGFVTHFMYEQFHPNHELDLKMYTDEFVELLFGEHVSDFDTRHFTEPVMYKGDPFDHSKIPGVVESFQLKLRAMKLDCVIIECVEFDLAKRWAEVSASIVYSEPGSKPVFEGKTKVNYIHELGYWYIAAFEISGEDL